MSFDKNQYEIVRNAITPEVVAYIKTLIEIHENSGYIFKNPTQQNPFPFGDTQTPESFAQYSPIYGEALLPILKPIVSSATNLSLLETYSYFRIYYKNATLKKHVDRFSCEISATLCIQKQVDWPIKLQTKTEEVSIELEPGDMLIYNGLDVPHWRDAYTGERHYQIFLHYVNSNGPHKDFYFDGRPGLCTPQQLQRK